MPSASYVAATRISVAYAAMSAPAFVPERTEDPVYAGAIYRLYALDVTNRVCR